MEPKDCPCRIIHPRAQKILYCPTKEFTLTEGRGEIDKLLKMREGKIEKDIQENM